MDDIPVPVAAGKSRFIQKLREDLRARGYAYATERTYLHWIKRFIYYSGRRHPKELGAQQVEQFLNALAVKYRVSPATQRTALNALVYLYVKFFGRPPEDLVFEYAKPSRRLPVVLTHSEVEEIMQHMSGTPRLMIELLYGSGLRLQECLNLRVKDIDFGLNVITVREGKGNKDRTTLLPAITKERLEIQIDKALSLHKQDIADGYGEVYLPYALERKYADAAKSAAWQYVFPSSRLGKDPRSGTIRRHHLHSTSLRKHLKVAMRKTNIHKRVTTHTFRHSFATRLLQNGYDIRTIQKLQA